MDSDTVINLGNCKLRQLTKELRWGGGCPWLNTCSGHLAFSLVSLLFLNSLSDASSPVWRVATVFDLTRSGSWYSMSVTPPCLVSVRSWQRRRKASGFALDCIHFYLSRKWVIVLPPKISLPYNFMLALFFYLSISQHSPDFNSAPNLLGQFDKWLRFQFTRILHEGPNMHNGVLMTLAQLSWNWI